MKRVIIILGLALLVATLAGGATPAAKDTKTGKALTELRWDTKGGGQINFSVKRQVDATFAIIVQSYNNNNFNFAAMLSDRANPIYALLDGIFKGKIDVSQDRAEPKGPTGTWTVITLEYAGAAQKTLDKIDLDGPHSLNRLYQYIESILPENAKQRPSDLGDSSNKSAEDFIIAFIRQIHEKNWAAVYELYDDSVKEEIAETYNDQLSQFDELTPDQKKAALGLFKNNELNLQSFFDRAASIKYSYIFMLTPPDYRVEFAKVFASNSLYAADFTISYSQNGARTKYPHFCRLKSVGGKFKVLSFEQVLQVSG